MATYSTPAVDGVDGPDGIAAEFDHRHDELAVEDAGVAVVVPEASDHPDAEPWASLAPAPEADPADQPWTTAPGAVE